MIRILIADDQELVRTGFRVVLDAEPDLEVVGEAADGHAAIDAVETLTPDIVLMDIRMPNLDGIEATRRIAGRDGAPRILILNTFDLDDYAMSAARGSSGFLSRTPAPRSPAGREHAAGDALLACDHAPTDRELPRRSTHRAASGPARRADATRARSPPVAQGLSNADAAHATAGAATVATHVARISPLDSRPRPGRSSSPTNRPRPTRSPARSAG